MKKSIKVRLIKSNGFYTGVEIIQYSGKGKKVILLNEREMEYLWEKLDKATEYNADERFRRSFRGLNQPF